MNFPSITFDIEKHRKKFNKINPIFEMLIIDSCGVVY